MAESTALVGNKRRSLTAPVFVTLVLGAALVRGYFGASTTTGRVVMIATMGTLFVLCATFSVWLMRQPPEQLEIGPERVVLWQRPGRGIQLGTEPPLQVTRAILRAGTHMTTTWYLADASETAVRLDGEKRTPLKGVAARIDLTSFHPTEVFEEVQRAGWPVEQRI